MTSHKDKKRCLSLFFYGDTDVADAKRYMREINFEKIITQHRQQLDKNPKDTTARVNLANAYLRKNMLDEALPEYLLAIEHDPDILLAHYNLGILYFTKKEFDLAKKEWEAVLAIDPGFTPAKKFLKKSHNKKGLRSRFDALPSPSKKA